MASRLPSALKMSLLTAPTCPRSVRSFVPVDTSQRRTVPSEPADARRLPSGLSWIQLIPPLCPASVVTTDPVSIRQIVTNPSSPAVASRVLSGLKSMLVGNRRVCAKTSRPLAASLTRITWSPPVDARYRPSGLKARLPTQD